MDAATRLANLITLRDTGVASTTNDGQTTQFRTVEDLDRAINRLQRELGQKRRPKAKSVYMGHR